MLRLLPEIQRVQFIQLHFSQSSSNNEWLLSQKWIRRLLTLICDSSWCDLCDSLTLTLWGPLSETFLWAPSSISSHKLFFSLSCTPLRFDEVYSFNGHNWISSFEGYFDRIYEVVVDVDCVFALKWTTDEVDWKFKTKCILTQCPDSLWWLWVLHWQVLPPGGQHEMCPPEWPQACRYARHRHIDCSAFQHKGGDYMPTETEQGERGRMLAEGAGSFLTRERKRNQARERHRLGKQAKRHLHWLHMQAERSTDISFLGTVLL